jgi:hypothetical protein
MMVNRCSILLKIAKNWPSIRHRHRNTDHQIAVLIQPRMTQGLRMLGDEDSGAPPGCSDGGDHSASARAIEGLARDPEIAASAGHIAGAAIDIHPGQTTPGFPAQFHAGASRLAPTGVAFLCEFAFRHSIRVSLIILNENHL